jgi:hypothetical protein
MLLSLRTLNLQNNKNTPLDHMFSTGGACPPPWGGYKDPKGGARAHLLSNIFTLSVHKNVILLSNSGNYRVLQCNSMRCTPQ